MPENAPPTQDELFMRRALKLAAETTGLASPNPQVGCVLVRTTDRDEPEVIGEGAHLYANRDHAEIVALKQAAERGLSPKGATAYVTLEPCSHYGRTGPCADALIAARIARLQITFIQRAFPENRHDFDFIVRACYGLGPSLGQFKIAKYQVAEKILIDLPAELQKISLVVIDGPFTAFDPYGSSGKSQFGSAKHTNHWTATDPSAAIPQPYAPLMNALEFAPFAGTHFEAMRQDSALAVPASRDARYLGSRFTMRVVENNPAEDRRTVLIQESAPHELHVFSGKVVSAVKAARQICDHIERAS